MAARRQQATPTATLKPALFSTTKINCARARAACPAEFFQRGVNRPRLGRDRNESYEIVAWAFTLGIVHRNVPAFFFFALQRYTFR